MNEAKHTPGPWFFDGGCVEAARPHMRIAFLPSDYEQGKETMGKADGHLIAAAPDLLAACQHARGCVPYLSDAHSKIVAAIAKATGESAL